MAHLDMYGDDEVPAHDPAVVSCIDAIKRILKRYENEFGGGAATKHQDSEDKRKRFSFLIKQPI